MPFLPVRHHCSIPFWPWCPISLAAAAAHTNHRSELLSRHSTPNLSSVTKAEILQLQLNFLHTQILSFLSHINHLLVTKYWRAFLFSNLEFVFINNELSLSLFSLWSLQPRLKIKITFHLLESHLASQFLKILGCLSFFKEKNTFIF